MINAINKSSFCDKGIRENNEDYIIQKDNVCILCDGMGGHGHGEIASKTIAESVMSYLISLSTVVYTEDDFQKALDFALSELNAQDTFDSERKMGTTLVVVAINPSHLLIGHVGDSRCYVFDEHTQILFRSKDHSKVAEAVEAEILTEEEAWSNPNKNILTRCVIAGKDKVIIEIDKIRIYGKNRLFLCSDGVVDALRDNELQAILINRDIEEALNIIKSECVAKSHDNYSAILIDVEAEAKPEGIRINDEVIDDNIIINDDTQSLTYDEKTARVNPLEKCKDRFCQYVLNILNSPIFIKHKTVIIFALGVISGIILFSYLN